jgi:MoxR-like ATPase
MGTKHRLPELPSLLTKPLGLEGWVPHEPVLLAALASEDPLLLIGPHGSAKSFLLEQLARALGLEYRFYNASLLNYDDLVGIPIPDEERKRLHYINTPAAIWDAEVVFFDEINRTRPELQNKLFPIVHEKRVQGIALDKLRYRWSAMNPCPSAEGQEGSLDVYIGAEPLDPALADRFCFLLEVPSWQDLSKEEKRQIFRDQFKGRHPFPVPLEELLACARAQFAALQLDHCAQLEDYILTVLDHLETKGIRVSARRATILYRNILAVHAARMALYKFAQPEISPQRIDWKTSALVALQNSLPQVVSDVKPDRAALLAAHRQAWELSQLDSDNPWHTLLQIKDPLDRCVAATQMGERVKDDDLSKLVSDALAAQTEPSCRTAIALAIYAAVHRTRNLHATVFETMAQDIRKVLRPGQYSHSGEGARRDRYRRVKDLCAKLEKEDSNGSQQRNQYAMNLLQGLLPDGYGTVTPDKVLKLFLSVYDQLIYSDNR